MRGKWLQEAGFIQGLPVKIRVMPRCLIITGQDINELWQCLEGLSVESFEAEQQQLTLEWLKQYPNGLMIES
ncbi:SymE family type I addiction module toxin [Serratia microhaemolytica]|uniref:SymE family type I addiction module toxin n=1 Tax=Serratia microhaemolytica TaxID=2675110 RepID=UPI001F0CD5C5|nr:SymE family type I addiction module toxin [Serratia microhaemolytica]